MATPIPLIGAPQPGQGQEQEQKQQMLIQMNVDVQPGQTVFKAQVSPFEIRVMPVPDNIMLMAVQTWLLQHPQDAIMIMVEVKRQFKQAADIVNTVHATKNG